MAEMARALFFFFFFFLGTRKEVDYRRKGRQISFLSYKHFSFLSPPIFFPFLYSPPSLPSFLSFLPFFPSLFYLFIKVYCKPFNLVAFSIKVSAAYPKFVLSIEYSTVRSAKSVLNLVLLLSRLIHKFRLLGLTRFIMGYQKSSSDEHDCTWKL